MGAVLVADHSESDLGSVLLELERQGIQDVGFTKCLGWWHCERVGRSEDGMGMGRTRVEAARGLLQIHLEGSVDGDEDLPTEGMVNDWTIHNDHADDGPDEYEDQREAGGL